MERNALHLDAIESERMHVSVPGPLPVREFDGDLQRALRGAHELGFVDLQAAVELQYGWNRRFAHTDRADLLRFDELDAEQSTRVDRKRRGRHPAGGASTDDHDLSDSSVH